MCADSGNAVAEGSHKDNNCAAALVPLIVTQSQLPDLAVTDILVPMEARAGQTVTLTWVVSNLGEVATPISAWSDYVYLSRDRVMDTTDSRLGWARHDGVLAVGESYTNSLDVTIPKTVAGPCYFYVHTDQNDAVVELDEENNCLLSQSAVSISLPPQADLQIIGIFPPATATPGVSNTFTWVITNAGPNTAEGTWVDSVYLSPDPVWDASDAVVGRISHQGPLAPGETYTASLTTPVPGLTPGDYYVIVRTDLRNSVRETSEMNNIAVAESATFVDVLELTLGQAFTNQLTLGAENYYGCVA